MKRVIEGEIHSKPEDCTDEVYVCGAVSVGGAVNSPVVAAVHAIVRLSYNITP